MTVLCMYNEFLFIEKMQCGYKELLLSRTFSYGYLGLLYPESTVYTLCGVDIPYLDQKYIHYSEYLIWT